MRSVQPYTEHGSKVSGADSAIFFPMEHVSMADPLKAVEELRTLTIGLTKKTEALSLRVEVLARRVEGLSDTERKDVEQLKSSIEVFADRMTELTIRVERLSEAEREDAGRLSDAIEQLRVLTLSLAERTSSIKDHLKVLPGLLEERSEFVGLRALVEENHAVLKEFLKRIGEAPQPGNE